MVKMKKKKLLSVFLAVLMLVSSVTVGVVVYAETRKQEVAVDYVDQNGNILGRSMAVVDEGAYNINSSAFADIPEGYELANVGDYRIGYGVVVELRAATTQTVGVNYWDVENDKQAGEGEVTVDADAWNVNSSELTDIPEGYELTVVGDFAINDGWIFVSVRPVVTTKTVGVNYWDVENGKQAGEGEVTVDADATNVNTSALTDIPEGYELATLGDISINDGWIYVEVRPVATTQTVGVNYWDVENGKQAGEGKIMVDADATNVNTSALTDVPEGYELAAVGDVTINDGWIFVDVRPVATEEPAAAKANLLAYSADAVNAGKTVTVIYYIPSEGRYVLGESVAVAEDETNVNTTTLTDIPQGYELVNLGDVRIGYEVVAEVRPITTQTVGVNYWDVENDKQVCEGEVTVDVDAWNVNSSALTDIPAGYELVSVGDFAINDGWIWVEVRPAAITQTVSIIYWDKDNDVQVGEGEVTVDADATIVNTSVLTDIPEGYELAEAGDYFIEDGVATILVRAAAQAGLLGDVDANGVVDASDAMQILQYDAHLIELTDAQLAVADVDANGVVDASDAMRILQYDAHIIPSL